MRLRHVIFDRLIPATTSVMPAKAAAAAARILLCVTK
jgi:hypothetical protein